MWVVLVTKKNKGIHLQNVLDFSLRYHEILLITDFLITTNEIRLCSVINVKAFINLIYATKR